MYFAVSTPHSTRANTGDLHTHEMNTRTDFLVARALCLSNPASKGRRWRRDASRPAILRLEHLFNLCYRPALAFSPPTTQTHKQQQQPNFRCCRHSFAFVFSAAKTSRRAIPFTSSRRPISIFSQLFEFLDVLENLYHSYA